MKRGFTRLDAGCSLLMIGLAALFFYPVYVRLEQRKDQVASCGSHLKILGLGMHQYAADYGGRFPSVALHKAFSGGPSDTRAYGWADALWPYTKSKQILQCPQVLESTWRDKSPTQAGFTDYFFNSNLSALSLKRISQPNAAILLGDGNDGRGRNDARYSLRALPPAWFEDKSSPLWRHANAANFLFADGHVKLIAPSEFRGAYSFNIRPAQRVKSRRSRPQVLEGKKKRTE